jgi:hypothetical protein
MACRGDKIGWSPFFSQPSPFGSKQQRIIFDSAAEMLDIFGMQAGWFAISPPDRSLPTDQRSSSAPTRNANVPPWFTAPDSNY